MIVALFDIDMTLIDPAGAGRAAMTAAFEEMFGVADGLEGVPFAGRTDRFILREALARHGLLDSSFDDTVRRFADLYASHLARVLPSRDVRPMPGACEVVARLAGDPGIRVGLATGNFRSGAMLKLKASGLDTHLRDGGFGDDHVDRAGVVADAAKRVANGAGDMAAERPKVFVIGDTEHDVEAAKANGFTAVAVATGFTGIGELIVAGADLAFLDLGDAEQFVAALLATDEGWQDADEPGELDAAFWSWLLQYESDEGSD